MWETISQTNTKMKMKKKKKIKRVYSRDRKQLRGNEVKKSALGRSIIVENSKCPPTTMYTHTHHWWSNRNILVGGEKKKKVTFRLPILY